MAQRATKLPFTEKTFRDVYSCLKYTADAHGTDVFEIVSSLDDDGKTGFREWFGRIAGKFWRPQAPKESEGGKEYDPTSLLTHLAVIVTGARPGEIIMGTKTQSKDAVMKICKGTVPPMRQFLDTIRSDDDAWKRFLRKLSVIEYFSRLTMVEREMWLEEYQSENDVYLEDVENLEVEILDFGSSDLLNLPEDVLEQLHGGEIYDMKEIADAFPGKPGSEGLKGRHTLMFRRGIWKVSTVFGEVREYPGIVIDSVNGVVAQGATAEEDQKIVTFDTFAKKYGVSKGKNIVEENQTVGVLLPKKTTSKRDLENMAFVDKDLLKRVKHATRGFTAAGYKSLLQKIIRFRAKRISWEEDGVLTEHDSTKVLECVILILILHPGSFVPDIQRFVSGAESALKRVIVSLFEDSYIFPLSNGEHERLALNVITGAYLAQRLPGWKPDMDTVVNVMQLSAMGLNTADAFVFDTKAGCKLPPYVISEKSKPLEAVSAVMEELKSFQGDLGMIRYEVKNRYSGTEKTTRLNVRPDVMPLEHCIDQHWAPEIAYMYPREFIEKNRTSGNAPFSGLFVRLFSEVTGVNPRRPLRKGTTMAPIGYTDDFETEGFTQLTRGAQHLVLLSKQTTPLQRGNIKGTYNLKYTLDRSWISGMVGAIEIKGRPPALVTLHPEDPEVLVAVRKPSRDMKTPFLTDEQNSYALDKAMELLTTVGVPLNKTQPPIPEMKGSVLIWDEETSEYFIKMKNSSVRWDEFRVGEIAIPYVEDVDLDLMNAVIYDGEGIVVDADKKLLELLKDTRHQDIQKCITYLGRNASVFEFKRIGRDGDGTQGVVSVEDVGAYQLLMKIKLMYPSAFSRVHGNALKFQINVAPLVWHIREILVKYLSGAVKYESKKWGTPGEKLQRKMWEHQVSSVEEMKDSHELGRRGSFIWIPVGMGKSLIVMKYLEWLWSENKLPKYVIYTLPSSAIKSIMSEIEGFGFQYRLIVPLAKLDAVYKTSEGKPKKHIVHGSTPVPYVINLIEHDHLRRCEGELSGVMANSVFVIDEVHKALNDTKRTAVALQLSHLSREFIALTGTPVIDTNTYKLIWWLEQIVPFEVNEKNFWVAANGMVSKKVATTKEIVRKDIEVEMSNDMMKKYESLVPPGLGGKNSHPRSEDFMNAMKLCYDVVDVNIVRMVKSTLKSGHRPLVVARDAKHQEKLFREITKVVPSKDVFMFSYKNPIYLTDESVRKKEVHPYQVVITTMRYVEGYTVTYLDTMITSVYPSNNASREQLEGRINRISQTSDTVTYITLHCGILTHILHRHNDSRNLAAVLSSLADEIDMKM